MNDHNSVRVTGWLARDAEIRYSQSGTPMTFLNINVGGQEGEKKSYCYIDVKVFGQQVLRFEGATKGARVCVMGRLVQDSWDDKKTGAKRYKHAIHADAAFLIAEAREDDEAPKKAKAKPKGAGQQSLPQQETPVDYGDIPF